MARHVTFKIKTFPIVKSTKLLPITQQKISPGRPLGTGNEGMLMTNPGVRGRKTPVKNITNDRCVLPFREDCVLIVRPGPSLKKRIIIIKAPSYNSLQFRLTNTYLFDQFMLLFVGTKNTSRNAQVNGCVCVCVCVCMCLNDTTTCWQTVGDKWNLSLFSPTVSQHVVVLSHTPI